MKRGMYLAAALCLLLCGCGKKDAAEAQAVQQRYAALTGDRKSTRLNSSHSV